MLLLVLALLMAASVSCTETESGPRAWIDFPRDGSSVPVGSPISIVSHAYAREGVAEILLSVDGVAYRRDPPESPGATLTEVTQEWTPGEAGVYTLQVTTYDTTGAASTPDSIAIRVAGAAAAAPTDTPVPTTVPTGVPTAVPTAVPTSVPTAVPTGTPVPSTSTPVATDTPVPAAEVSFWVEDDSITSGECTVLHWDVENATAVFVDDVSVARHGTQTICPAATTTYNLRVEAPAGNVNRSVVVTVSAAVDTTPPPVPAPTVPADELVLSCRSTQDLVWVPVTDDSGISGYYVKLEYQATAGVWDTVRGWGPVTDKQVEAEVDCGIIYRWAVRAQDGAGNYSAWSEWFTFSIDLG
jgi:hypothetical protein